MTRPLEGIRVLDFSTLLPGPMATLMLAEAGAEVIKIERPGSGEEMRRFEPMIEGESVNFALLNRGKRSLAIDLKDAQAKQRLRPLIESCDIVVEQFRPGVMQRLGLGYEDLKAINPRIIYCAITGFGQDGPRAQEAAHDLNYVAHTGLLNMAAGADGAPVVPMALVADIAGGTYPAVINILLALRQRDRDGVGCKLDISMTDQLFTFMYGALGSGFALSDWPMPSAGLTTGGSPRYQIYRTKDDRFLACAPLEQKFWDNFCDVIGLDTADRVSRDWDATKRAVAALVRSRSAAQWQQAFDGKDVCVCVVNTLQDALADSHFVARGLFAHQLAVGTHAIPATVVPVAAQFRAAPQAASSPRLGEANAALLGETDQRR